MKKILAMAAALALALAFAGCSSPGSIEVVSDDEGVHVKATGAADGEAWGDIDLQDGQGICMNPAVTKGTISIRIADNTGATLYDGEVSGSSSILVPEATGSCDLVVTAKGAEGTVEVFAYDIATAAETDAEVEKIQGDQRQSNSAESASDSAATTDISSSPLAGMDPEGLVFQNGLGDYVDAWPVQREDGTWYWNIVARDVDGKEYTAYIEADGTVSYNGYDGPEQGD